MPGSDRRERQESSLEAGRDGTSKSNDFAAPLSLACSSCPCAGTFFEPGRRIPVDTLYILMSKLLLMDIDATHTWYPVSMAYSRVPLQRPSKAVVAVSPGLKYGAW